MLRASWLVRSDVKEWNLIGSDTASDKCYDMGMGRILGRILCSCLVHCGLRRADGGPTRFWIFLWSTIQSELFSNYPSKSELLYSTFKQPWSMSWIAKPDTYSSTLRTQNFRVRHGVIWIEQKVHISPRQRSPLGKAEMQLSQIPLKVHWYQARRELGNYESQYKRNHPSLPIHPLAPKSLHSWQGSLIRHPEEGQ